MQITTISYGYTFNRGNYQSERIDFTATIAEGEDAALATYLLKAEVLRLGGDVRGAEEALHEVYDRTRAEGHPRG